ncbi:MAG: F0F1 ATP synthase subunit delta [Propionibacteriaceae bacterium]|nr:F0F1 ATP synthase subunit delta [Propionibacteriaceae bacterium]
MTVDSAQASQDWSLMAWTMLEYPALARALTDLAASDASKQELINQTFKRCQVGTRQQLLNASDQVWTTAEQLTNWVRAQAIEACWQLADQTIGSPACMDQLFAFASLIRADHRLRAALTDRLVPWPKRSILVDQILADQASASHRLISLALSWDKDTVDQQLRTIMDHGASRQGQVLAIITVARALDTDRLARLSAAVAARLGKDIVVELRVDPSVVGGVRIDCGDQLIDATMAARLEAARRDFQ